MKRRRLRLLVVPIFATRIARWIFALMGIALLLLALWKIPEWQVSSLANPSLQAKDRFELENEARKTLAQLTGGVLLIIGLVITGRRVRALERNVEVAQEGQITERFTRAIEQLGAVDGHGRKKLEIRLGGIYALERIARDSEKDHWTVMEVLTAYVRENAPWKEEGEEVGQLSEYTLLRTDIQAVLTVLGRRSWRDKEAKEGRVLNLSKTNVRKANLEKAHLGKAVLYQAHLEKANLSGANLEKANLREAHLEKAKLNEANLENANLDGAHLVNADLDRAHLEKANLSEAHLENANLSEANLEKAKLNEAHLENANLMDAHLEKANLREAHLEKADLRHAHLEKANLSEAHLEKADLSGAHLENAILGQAHLEKANLAGALGLTQEQLDEAVTDEETVLPSYVQTSPRGKPEV